MKNIILLLTLTLLFGCSNNEKSNTIKKIEVEKLKIEFPKYSSVIEMLKSSGDYKKEDGNLKVLSNEGEQLHIQVSNWFFEGDIEKVIMEQVKRDIIYVSFQAFAETDINELTITSVPLKMKDIKTQDKYLEEYKSTITISRKVAKKILLQYLDTDSFQKLYQLHNGQIWLPNSRFDELKYKQIYSVYNDLIMYSAAD